MAFAGDVNTANSAGRVLDHGIGAAEQVLARADVAMVNTETVLADDRTGLVRQPKAYNFVAPTRLLDVLDRAGVDVVTVATITARITDSAASTGRWPPGPRPGRN